MENIYINAKRNGYEPEQCGETLTVGDLIDLLGEFDSDAKIYLKHDNGYTYGSIVWGDVE